MVKAILIFLGVLLVAAFLLSWGIAALVSHLAEPHCGNCKYYNSEIGACEKHCTNALRNDLCEFWGAIYEEDEEGGQDNG